MTNSSHLIDAIEYAIKDHKDDRKCIAHINIDYISSYRLYIKKGFSSYQLPKSSYTQKVEYKDWLIYNCSVVNISTSYYNTNKRGIMWGFNPEENKDEIKYELLLDPEDIEITLQGKDYEKTWKIKYRI